MTFITDSDCSQIVINGTPVCALCGPVLRGGAEYEGGATARRKIVADAGNLPVIEGQTVDIDGEVWEVSDSVVWENVASVTFVRYGS